MLPVDVLLTLPWTIRRTEHQYDGEKSVELSVSELDGFVVCGDNDAEAEEQFWSALQLFLESFEESGESPPLPAAVRRRIVEDSGEHPIVDYPLSGLELVQPGRIGMTKCMGDAEFAGV